MQAQNPNQDLIALSKQVRDLSKDESMAVGKAIYAKKQELAEKSKEKYAQEQAKKNLEGLKPRSEAAITAIQNTIQGITATMAFIEAELSFLAVLEAMEQYKQKLKSPIAQLTGAPGKKSPSLDWEKELIGALAPKLVQMSRQKEKIPDKDQAMFKLMASVGKEIMGAGEQQNLARQLLIARLSQPMRAIESQAIVTAQSVQPLLDELLGRNSLLQTVKMAEDRLGKMQAALSSANKAEADLKRETPNTSDESVNTALKGESARILGYIKTLQEKTVQVMTLQRVHIAALKLIVLEKEYFKKLENADGAAAITLGEEFEQNPAVAKALTVIAEDGAAATEFARVAKDEEALNFLAAVKDRIDSISTTLSDEIQKKELQSLGKNSDRVTELGREVRGLGSKKEEWENALKQEDLGKAISEAKSKVGQLEHHLNAVKGIMASMSQLRRVDAQPGLGFDGINQSCQEFKKELEIAIALRKAQIVVLECESFNKMYNRMGKTHSIPANHVAAALEKARKAIKGSLSQGAAIYVALEAAQKGTPAQQGFAQEMKNRLDALAAERGIKVVLPKSEASERSYVDLSPRSRESAVPLVRGNSQRELADSKEAPGLFGTLDHLKPGQKRPEDSKEDSKAQGSPRSVILRQPSQLQGMPAGKPAADSKQEKYSPRHGSGATPAPVIPTPAPVIHSKKGPQHPAGSPPSPEAKSPKASRNRGST